MDIIEQRALTTRFWRFLWSSILVALSGCLGNVVDGMIVGNLIGGDGVSAINFSRPVIQFMFTVSMLVSSGGGLVVGYSLGRKEYDRTRYVFTVALIVSMTVGVTLSLIGALAGDAATRLLCDNAALFDLSRDYLRVVLLGAPAYLLMWHLSMMVNVDGSPRLVSLAVVVDNAVNLALDVVFIKYCGWGIAGSSAATVVGHLVGIAIMLWHYRYPACHLRPSLRHNAPELHNIISQGAPLALASICLTLLLFAANKIVLNTTGREGIFVFAVCMNLLQIYNLYLSGTCRTMQSLGSVLMGERNDEGFRLVMRKSFGFLTVTMLITCALVWIYPQGIAALFGAHTMQDASSCNAALRIFALSFIPFCYIYAVMIVYKLFAHHRMALFISLALSLTVIPVLWLVARLAPGLIWYSYLIAYAIEAALIILIHRASHITFEVQSTK